MRELDWKSTLVAVLIGGFALALIDKFWLKSGASMIKAFFLGAVLGFAVQSGERLTGAS
jgi:hypothetical protein